MTDRPIKLKKMFPVRMGPPTEADMIRDQTWRKELADRMEKRKNLTPFGALIAQMDET